MEVYGQSCTIMDEDVGEWLGGAFHSAEFERVDERAQGSVLIIAGRTKEVRRLRMANAAQAGERRGAYAAKCGTMRCNAYTTCVAERTAQKKSAARNAFCGE